MPNPIVMFRNCANIYIGRVESSNISGEQCQKNIEGDFFAGLRFERQLSEFSWQYLYLQRFFLN